MREKDPVTYVESCCALIDDVCRMVKDEGARFSDGCGISVSDTDGSCLHNMVITED